MWEYSSDDGQQRLMILIPCARSKRGPPLAPPWAPPAPRDQMSCREPQRVRSASLPAACRRQHPDLERSRLTAACFLAGFCPTVFSEEQIQRVLQTAEH